MTSRSIPSRVRTAVSTTSFKGASASCWAIFFRWSCAWASAVGTVGISQESFSTPVSVPGVPGW